jgi:hypothetical protein
MNERTDWQESDVMVSYDPQRNRILYTQISTGATFKTVELNPVSRWQRILQSVPGLIKSLSKDWRWF